MRPWCAVLGCAAVVLLSPARARAEVELQTAVSAKRVEVGESFAVQLTAMGDASEPPPTSPALRAPPAVVVHGPNVAPSQHVTIMGGRIQQRRGFSATWSVTPERVGKLRIGPPTVRAGNQTLQGEVVIVDVVPSGQGGAAQQRRRGRAFDPFDDPFDLLGRPRGSLRGLFDDLFDHGPMEPPVTNVPEELRVDQAPDRFAFLRNVVTPRHAVVGQEIKLVVYAYGSQGPFRESSPTEPKRPDFVAYPSVESSYGQGEYRVPIGETIWIATKLRELLLFPIKAGRLELGGMKMGFEGRRYRGRHGPPLMREAETETVEVSEPPLQGRPAGYVVGDVGRYELEAEVEPRQVKQGEAVSVIVTLSGRGNVPLEVRVPQQTGVEWLKPSVRSEVEVQSGRVGGFRSFSYVVRLDRAGDVDLGEVTLPHYDAEARRYLVARAPLGRVQVTASANPPKASAPRGEAEAALEPRVRLGPGAPPVLYLGDRPAFWIALAAAPLGVVLAGGTLRVGGVMLRRRRERRGSGDALAAAALKQAERALAAGDVAAVAAAVERALFTAIEARIGLKARGVLRSALAAELEGRGVPDGVAARVVELLDACEALRFAGSPADVSTLVGGARETVRALPRVSPSGAKPV